MESPKLDKSIDVQIAAGLPKANYADLPIECQKEGL